MYNRLFSKILQSSVWLEPDPTRLVWITLLAAMDRDGFAHFSAVGNLAHAARVSLEDATKAIETLENPDPQSENPNNDGRRIERVPGGWNVLNAAEYANIANSEHARALARDRAKAYRARHGKPEPVTDASRDHNATVRTHHETVTTSDSEASAIKPQTRARPRAPKAPGAPIPAQAKTVGHGPEPLYLMLVASGGALPNPRSAAVQYALDRIGGWQRIAMRPQDDSQVRHEFCTAYRQWSPDIAAPTLNGHADLAPGQPRFPAAAPATPTAALPKSALIES